MLFARYWAIEKSNAIPTTFTSSFFPKKTIARLVQPMPLDMLGTNDESLRSKSTPVTDPVRPARTHDNIL